MALNFSCRPIFPAHMSEDNLVSPMRIVNGYLAEGIPERNGESFVRPQREVDNCFADYGRDRVDRCGSPESVSKDIIDLLPSDPFGMDISTTFTAITGWLEDLNMEYAAGYERNKVGSSKDDYGFFAGFNLLWNGALKFPTFPANVRFEEKFNTACPMDQYTEKRKEWDVFSQVVFGSMQNVGNVSGFGQKIEEPHEAAVYSSDQEEGAPHEAFVFALSYLGVRDLLSIERVCTSLRSTVRSDPLLWRSIHIDQPLNERITDEVLLQLTKRAQGQLQCLSLVECPRITADGVKCVLETNPKLTKLCVPGCTRLSIEGIVHSLKTFKLSQGSPGIRNLRVGGLYGVTHEHFEELKFLLGADSHPQQNCYKPHFYHRGNLYLLCDDDRAIDIETCPRCQKLRLVYDCPAEGCQVKDQGNQVCRACTLCIARCVQCGRCITDSEYEETFCLELLCSDCMKQLLQSPEKQERDAGFFKDALDAEPSYNSSSQG